MKTHNIILKVLYRIYTTKGFQILKLTNPYILLENLNRSRCSEVCSDERTKYWPFCLPRIREACIWEQAGFEDLKTRRTKEQ
jgi:hypothetical protein